MLTESDKKRLQRARRFREALAKCSELTRGLEAMVRVGHSMKHPVLFESLKARLKETKAKAKRLAPASSMIP